jgi:hypothetical protein
MADDTAAFTKLLSSSNKAAIGLWLSPQGSRVYIPPVMKR